MQYHADSLGCNRFVWQCTMTSLICCCEQLIHCHFGEQTRPNSVPKPASIHLIWAHTSISVVYSIFVACGHLHVQIWLASSSSKFQSRPGVKPQIILVNVSFGELSDKSAPQIRNYTIYTSAQGAKTARMQHANINDGCAKKLPQLYHVSVTFSSQSHLHHRRSLHWLRAYLVCNVMNSLVTCL